jgi:ADP-ribose pyrophosphatase YjhB (NUDIX family)
MRTTGLNSQPESVKRTFSRLAYLAAAALALAAVSACGGGGASPGTDEPIGAPAPSPAPTPDPQSAAIKLPIEVLGPAGYIEAVEFEIANAEGINRLYVQCHRCGWRDSSVASGAARGAKASARLNGGAWIAMDDTNATVAEPERSYGGIGGGFLTARFTVPISGAVAGKNTLEFRFNKDDGFTSGYRVLNFNLRGADGVDRLASSRFSEDDPRQWRVGVTSPADIAEGKALWEGKVALRESPLNNKPIKATCASCHAADGRDLKYFNYSDWSIQVRSAFHGLNALEARQLAAYVRNLDDEPVVAGARPWNPPFQPGPGLDAKPSREWAAGAGLQWVLQSDRDMLRHLFPASTSVVADTSLQNVARVVASAATLNIREMPIALQLPDWNSWLPEVHPVDLWADWDLTEPGQAYVALRQALESTGVDQLVRDRQLVRRFSTVNQSVRKFVDAGFAKGLPGSEQSGDTWRIGEGTNIKPMLGAYTREQAKLAIAQWSAIKQFELAQRFDLAARAPDVLPLGSELRAYPSVGQTVHPLAAHITGDNINCCFAWQSRRVGKYFSSVWYQLQMTINAGQRQPAGNQPQDWPYQFRHVRELSEETGVQHPVRMLQSMIKNLQNRDNGQGPVADGWQLRHIHPWWLYGSPSDASTVLWDALDDDEQALGLPQGLKKRLISAVGRETLRVTRSFATSPRSADRIGAWTVCTAPGGNSFWVCVQPATQTIMEPRRGFAFPENNSANNMAKTLRLFKERQWVDDDVRRGWIDWSTVMWPQHEWTQYQ